jgi:hypothetical protein
LKTEKVDISRESADLPERIVAARMQSNAAWVEAHGSGTLRDNRELGFVWSIQCLAERLAYTFGYGFVACKASSVTFNDAISECDERAYTVAGRWVKRYLARSLFPEDYFEVKYVIVRGEDGAVQWEGIGLIVRQTSASFIPDNTLVVAKIVRYDLARGAWDAPVNFA